MSETKVEHSAATHCYPDCWVFDVNRRVYRRDDSGRAIGGPIWFEHWRKVTINSETARSYVTTCRRKISKKGGPGIAFSYEEIERIAFVEENRYKISQQIQSIQSYDLLKRVAEMIGYTG